MSQVEDNPDFPITNEFHNDLFRVFKGMPDEDETEEMCDILDQIGESKKVKEGTEMGKIGDVYIKQFAGGKDKGLSVQLTSNKGGYVQMTKDEAKQIAERLLKWATSDSMAYPGDYE